MKVILSIAINFIFIFSFAQYDTVYFNKEWKKCNKVDAEYYRLIEEEGGTFIVKDCYLNNNPLMIAVCTSVEPLIKNGKCTYFHEDGSKKSEGPYVNNKPTGTWIWWEDNGNNSTVAEIRPDGTKRYIRFSNSFKSKNVDGVYQIVDEMPTFPGGIPELNKFIEKEFKLPKIDKKNNVKGKFYITFVVDENGIVIDPKILKSISPTCDEEALRVASKIPKWKPGILNGTPVKVQMTIPITVK